MDLKLYIKPFLKWWWLIIVSVLIAASASYIASKRSTPLYRTKTTLMIGNSIQNPDPNSSELYTGQQLASTYVQMAVREPVLKATVKSLGWDIDWGQLSSKISAYAVPQTQLIEIYAVDANPQTAKELADTVAQQLINLSPSGTSQINQDQLTFIRAQLTDLESKINSAKQDVIKLNTELDAANSAQEIQDLQNQISILETKITNWQGTYAQLLTTVQGGDVNALNILEEAGIPTQPFYPNTRMNVLIAAAIGLALAVGGIIIIEYLDDTLRAAVDTQALVNLPTLAKIGQINGTKNDSKLIALDDPLSPDVDSFRLLRMNIQSISNWQSLNTILFTSAEPSVGKSVTISNLAIVMAQFGNRVILVEADLRKPSLHKLFGVPKENGLKDVLANPDLSCISMLKSTKLENLKVLPSGSEQISSVEALGSERMKKIIKELSSIADIVLIDSPPALMFSDTFLLGKLVNGVIIVSRAGRTRTELLKRVVNDLQMAGINLLGVIIQHREVSEIYGHRYYRYYSDSSSNDSKADFSSNGHKKSEDIKYKKRANLLQRFQRSLQNRNNS
jgi:capsular exopolysaccharide synthesis family protein